MIYAGGGANELMSSTRQWNTGMVARGRIYFAADNADFNRDGKTDYLLFNASIRRTAIWYLDNNVFLSGAFGPTLPLAWSLAAP